MDSRTARSLTCCCHGLCCVCATQLTLTQAVTGVLSGVKEADIGKTLDSLSADERVGAMKFVYRGMATGQNCTQLLKWHSAIYDKDGAGSIMRVLVDRNL